MSLFIVAQEDQVAIVEVTASAVPAPRPYWVEMHETLGPTVFQSNVVLDLRHLDTINSEKIGWLVKCDQMFRNGGGSLVLTGIQTDLQRSLQLLQLDKVLQIAANREEAKKRLPKGDQISQG